MTFKLTKLALATMPLVTLLSGCWEGSSQIHQDKESPSSESLEIKAIDGYLRDAQVWLDLNGNYQREPDEPSSTSGEGGLAILDVSGVGGDITSYPVMARAIAGRTVDEDNPGVPLSDGYLMTAPPGSSVVTPVTTLVALKMTEGKNKEEAIEEVNQLLAQPESNLTSDYLADGNELLADSARALVQLLPQQVEDIDNFEALEVLVQGAELLGDEVRQQESSGQEPTLDKVVLTEIDGQAKLIFDKDGDGVEDEQDAFPDNQFESLDTDSDGIGNNADDDDDNDGWSDADEKRLNTDPLNADEVPADLDGDHITDSEDSDRDGDGVENSQDAFPDNSTESVDTDGDGTGNNADSDDDNDGWSDTDEVRLNTNSLDANKKPADLDGDHIADSEDSDRDGDGTDNVHDAFPNNKLESLDTDGDGIGNNTDRDDDNDGWSDVDEARLNTNSLDANKKPADLDGDFIVDSEDTDRDGDGIENTQDAFPDDSSEYLDTDRDGTGNSSDSDDDNDGWSDLDEMRLNTDPLDAANKPADLDGDHIADSEDSDRDGDGVENEKDAFPDNSVESLDTDGDGIGNNADSDDDNDNWSDVDEARLNTDPLDASQKPKDLDGDYIADSEDTDRDGDGVDNEQDVFPDDNAESLDTDGDGVGNNADTDDDGDGVLDVNDAFPLDKDKSATDTDTDSDGDGVNDSQDAFPLDRFETKDSNKDGWGDFASSDDDGDGTPDSLDATPQGEGSTGAISASVSLAVDGASAHWLSLDQFVYNGADGAVKNELWVSNADGALEFTDKSQFTAYALSYSKKVDDGRVPHLTGRDEYSTGLTAEVVKGLLKQRVYAVAVSDSGEAVAATKVQTPFLLDSLYTEGDADADESNQGAWLEDGLAQFRLWAPTAQEVELYLYDGNKRPMDNAPVAMTEDPVSGIWSYTGDASLENSFYRYRVKAYHPATDRIEWMMTTDPYSVSLSTASRYSQLVDLNSNASKPEGWDSQSITPLNKPEDNIIYELHIRDFSGSDTAGTADYNGGYLAFTEAERDSVKQLQSLRDAGLNTIHLLPSYDIATIPEEAERRVDITDDASKLCNADTGIAPSAPLCDIAKTGTISDILTGLDPSTAKAQEVMADIRVRDGFNWGYDPYHYNAPEGSYASQSDGVSRIKEYRSMVKALHGMGFRVVQDVVFNHTSASGLYNNSVLDKVVPGYYHRRNPDNGYVESSTCCDNTASEHRMFEKLVANSLVMWAENYKIDGFRFDLMGHLMKSSMVKAYEKVRAVDADTWIYGEGWDFGEVYKNARGINSSQWNMAGTGIGTYNDRMRDAVRGDHNDPMNDVPGFANAGDRFDTMGGKMDLIRLGMVGNLQEYPVPTASGAVVLGRDYNFGGHGAGYAADPQEAVNYVSKHDNQTLWDINQYKAKGEVSPMDRARMQILGLAPVMLGQGVPFLHMGTELLRSKSMERDSYDSGDWYNRVDFSKQSNNWNVGLPREDKDGKNWDWIKAIVANPNNQVTSFEINWADARFKEMLSIRSESELLRLGEVDQILKRVRFHATGDKGRPGTIVMSVDDGISVGEDLDPNNQALLVAINSSIWEQRVAIQGADGFELHPVLKAGNDERIIAARVENGELVIPGLTVAVFVKPQEAEQGQGMDVGPLDEAIYLRGEFSGWDTSLEMEYQGQGRYETEVKLGADSNYQFKIAASEWDAPHPQYNSFNLSLAGGGYAWNKESNGNLSVSIVTEGTYRFILDLSDIGNAKLNIVAPQDAVIISTPSYGDEAIYLRGTLTDWDSGSRMSYVGDDKYQTQVRLVEGEYHFKLASNDWNTVKLGIGELSSVDGGITLEDASNDNQILVRVVTPGQYLFELDAANKTLLVKLVEAADINGVMMQYFHWYNSEADNLWIKVADEASTLANNGITALWLPPAYKAMKRDDGTLDVGYSTYDLYDLGEFNQQETTRTRYGDKDQYLAAISSAHDAGIKIYADVVLNHKMGAEGTEEVDAVRVSWDNRNLEEGDKTIAAWTKFEFPARSGIYSDFKWSWYHFDGVDWDQNDGEKRIFKFRGVGKAWDSQVSSEFGNYDYLMGADLDMDHPDVVAELKRWGAWYVAFANLDGFRLDAIKHIKQDFFSDWLDSVRSKSDKGLFTVGEYWDPSVSKLQDYLKRTGYRMSLFDAPLHYNFHSASKGNGGYDMRNLMNNTLMASNPTHAVTLVENHDTQPLQALESPVMDWFKPLGYAFILLREEGYPNIFYADYYGASYRDKGKDNNYHDITISSQKEVLDKLLEVRKKYAYGTQRNYLDHWDVIGWTREGDSEHPEGVAVVMSDNSEETTKWMEIGSAHVGKCYVDALGRYDVSDEVCVNEHGWAPFKTKPGNVSVWVRK